METNDGVLSEPGTTRFAHFLQPIRDLAANWNIDIAGTWFLSQ